MHARVTRLELACSALQNVRPWGMVLGCAGICRMSENEQDDNVVDDHRLYAYCALIVYSYLLT